MCLQTTKSSSSSSSTTTTTSSVSAATPNTAVGFLDFCNKSPQDWKNLKDASTQKERMALNHFKKLQDVTSKDIQTKEPMTWLEEVVAILILAFGVPLGAFTWPPLIAAFGYFVVGNVLQTFQYFALFVLLPLTILPQPMMESLHYSWCMKVVMKYFSVRVIQEEAYSEEKRPRIIVAPPHGIFPYASVLSLAVYPSLCGYNAYALATSAALATPIFKQILRGVGVIDADRTTARRALEGKHPNGHQTIGISTGGVAEIFNACYPRREPNEVILMKRRKGYLKLAIRTGAEICPCYMYGHTEALVGFCGFGFIGKLIERISRTVGFAMVLIFGRWCMPIPNRTPLLIVTGKNIQTIHYGKPDEPTQDQIDELQQQVCTELTTLFDRYKVLYGWEDKKLVIT
mmetsp:Transcript_1988/g.2669  ORF Transcript_1988/g.2669 Transcript_1988/m.2669 type:complete len:401 (-) Transcript_1988:339-1541(-)|eukprot:CAMPEP_0194048302 /NCGR_PEP_ID=MMETSP0009_2-20130614/26840_1 /TAXON_ID=210454 /ORGANISM="Grammatophora oceanica, Strain CCMP 410" /LENGTH=400 /DNA_ID=CAMNT_0038694131 /DNA_START=157 /DNA_END=1359 /DNA_ORIENTATION=+